MRNKDDCDTPALLLDLDKMEKNSKRMSRFARDRGVALRPHAKTHKVPEIAKIQLQDGARGICLQKVSEAEVFADYGFDDIFVTNEIVGKTKTDKLARLADKIHLAVAVDNPANISELSRSCAEVGSELSVFVDIDVGLQRCGIPARDAPKLAAQISKEKNLVFKGVMGYDGHVGSGKTKDEREKLSARAMDEIVLAKKEIKKTGLEVEVTSVGGSVSTWLDAKNPEVTEVQPGMYLFNAINLVEAEVATWDECALTVLSTVMSRPTEDRAIIDAGSKAFHFDNCRFPRIVGYEEDGGAEIYHFSEEHGNVSLKSASARKAFQLGDKVEAIPYHCCTCINQHDEMIALRNGKVENVWKVAARGMMK